MTRGAPTAAQRRVLEAMRDGARACLYADVGYGVSATFDPRRPVTIRPQTVYWLARQEFIKPWGPQQTTWRVYAITDAGRAAVAAPARRAHRGAGRA